jgi:chorismate mutase
MSNHLSVQRLYGIRGAVCCENTAESIQRGVGRLCSRLFEQNALTAEAIVSIQFTLTSDLTALNPASALRKSAVKEIASQCALFCAVEPEIAGSLSRVIRVLITAYLPGNSRPVPAYLDGAEVLRPDLVPQA